MFLPTALSLAAAAAVSLASPIAHPRDIIGDLFGLGNPDSGPSTAPPAGPTGCFPALGFQPPANVPASLNNWWCHEQDEQGFFGFVYSVDACQKSDQLVTDFTRMRNDFKARYVRIYSACEDEDDMYDRIVDAAYQTGLGVYTTIWFGFDGGDVWKSRKKALINTIKTNPRAPFVVKSVDVGSEPLFDGVLPPDQLAAQIRDVKKQLKQYPITVAISEMQYGFVASGDENDTKPVLDAIDAIHAHEIPFFDSDAQDGSDAWNSINASVSWFTSRTNSQKKIIFTQTGWPSNDDVWKANSKSAVASVPSEDDFFELLDTKCATLKSMTPKGGVGWFWQSYSDSMLPGWGALDEQGNLKFKFNPATFC